MASRTYTNPFLGLLAFLLFGLNVLAGWYTFIHFDPELTWKRANLSKIVREQMQELLSQTDLARQTAISIHVSADHPEFQREVREEWETQLLKGDAPLKPVVHAFGHTAMDRFIESIKQSIAGNFRHINPDTIPRSKGRNAASLHLVILVDSMDGFPQFNVTLKPTLLDLSGKLIARAASRQLAITKELKVFYKGILTAIILAGCAIFGGWLLRSGLQADFVFRKCLLHWLYWICSFDILGPLLGIAWKYWWQKPPFYVFPITSTLLSGLFVWFLPFFKTRYSPWLYTKGRVEAALDSGVEEIADAVTSYFRRLEAGVSHPIAGQWLVDRVLRKRNKLPAIDAFKALDLSGQINCLDQHVQWSDLLRIIIEKSGLSGRASQQLEELKATLNTYRQILSQRMLEEAASTDKRDDDWTSILNRLDRLQVDTLPARKVLGDSRWNEISVNLPEDPVSRLLVLLKAQYRFPGVMEKAEQEQEAILQKTGIAGTHFRIRFHSKQLHFSQVHVLFGPEQKIGRKHHQGGDARIFTADPSVSRDQGVISWNNEQLWYTPQSIEGHQTRVNGEPIPGGKTTTLPDRSILELTPSTRFEVLKGHSWNLCWKAPASEGALPPDVEKYGHIQFSLYCPGKDNKSGGLTLAADGKNDIKLPDAVGPFQGIIRQDEKGYLRLYVDSAVACYKGYDPIALDTGLPLLEGHTIELLGISIEVSIL